MQSYNQINFNDVAPDELINYIVNKHHGFTKNMLSLTCQHSKQLALEGVPQAKDIYNVVDKLNIFIIQHFKDEEEILYPYAKKLLSWQRSGISSKVPMINMMGSPINRFVDEHDKLMEMLNDIRLVTNNYTILTDAKNQLKLLHAELFELEQDLQKQIHLENNVLFIKLIDLQNELITSKPLM